MGDQAMLDEVVAEIKAVIAKQEQVEAEIKQARAEHNAEEVAALRKKEERLDKEKEQLRTEKLLLLQRQPGVCFCVWQLWSASDSVCHVPNFAVHVQRPLAVIPENSVPAHFMERLTNALERLASRQEPVVHDTTDAALGDKTLQQLQRIGAVRDFEGDEAAGPAVLDAAAVQALADCRSETELVKRLTPVLWRLRIAGEGGDDDDACRFVLVNGENYQWLDNLAQPLRPQFRFKPDLFKAPRVCVKERAGTDKQGSGDCFIFGSLAHRHLQRDGCVRELFEATLELLTLEHLGKLVKYHRLIPGECRGMVFNGSQFWLFSSFDSQALKLVRGTWTAPGSAHLVRHFFDDQPPPPPPLLPLLRHFLSALRLRSTQVDGSAFLGAGSSGRVFAVQSTEPATRHAQRMALKLVPAAASDDWLFELTHEFKAMQDAAALGVPVVPVVADSLRVLEGVGGGYLLARCGVPLDATASQAACCAAFVALAALHARAVVHGDARLPNLLLVDGHAVWLDLSTGVLTGLASHTRAVHCCIDMETLACSVLQAAGVTSTPLPHSVAAAITAYNDSADAVHTLATAVWAAASGFRMDATLPDAPASGDT